MDRGGESVGAGEVTLDGAGSVAAGALVVDASARVMVVEGRADGRAAALLGAEGLVVETTCETDEMAQKLATTFEPHVVLLEVVTIDHDVRRFCELLQDVTRASIVVFCERGNETEVIAGYAAGARTVVIEPVGAHEFVARIRALLRRVRTVPEPAADVLTSGPMTLDRSQRIVTVDGRVVPMPRREFEIAEILMRTPGALVSRTDILRELWGSTRDAKSLAVQVGRLRARLAASGSTTGILTVRGVGYRLITE